MPSVSEDKFRAEIARFCHLIYEKGYVASTDGKRYREFGVDVYWVNDDGKIYHKHTSEVVEPYDPRPLPRREPR